MVLIAIMFTKNRKKRFREQKIKMNIMQRQSIIVLLNYTKEPITRGNLKKLCEEFNFPYHTLCRLKFPILYKDLVIHKVEFK